MLKQILTQAKLPKDKTTIMSGIKAVLAFLSLGTVHYIGFLMEIPFEIVSIVSLKFLTNFVATFTFYLTFCYMATKVFAFVISQLYYSALAPLAALTFAASRKFPERLRKPARRMHRETNIAEKLIYWVFFLVIFSFMFNFSYLKFDYSTVGRMTWMWVGGISFAAILKSGIMIRPTTQIKRILDKKRIALRRSLIRDYIYLLTGSAVALSFYTGMLRFEKIMTEDVVNFRSEQYQGQARVLLSIDDAYLLVESSFRKQTFFYLVDTIMIRLPTDRNK
ncbi:hypothetical protein ACSFE6_09650 [Pseudomonas baetica]|uniref:hypothetical protein n=1 Tax=Pseudomonas baetica TaxID=674054 RepID=UPI003EEF3E03